MNFEGDRCDAEDIEAAGRDAEVNQLVEPMLKCRLINLFSASRIEEFNLDLVAVDIQYLLVL